MFEVLSIVLVAFYVRLLVADKFSIGYDTYGHLYFAKEVKAQKSGPFGSIVRRIVGSSTWSSPFLWHWLVGFFPIDKVLRHQRFINPLLDAMFSIVIYLVALSVFMDRNAALFMVLLYVFTPMWFTRLSMGQRTSSFTPRLASEILLNLFLMVTLLPLDLPIWLSLFLGAMLSLSILSSSRFGTQAIFFITPLVSLLAETHVPFLALVIGILLSITVSKGACLKSIKDHVQHLVWYFRKNLKKNMAISKRNSIDTMFQNNDEKCGVLKRISLIIYRAIAVNSYTGVLLKMPVLVALIAMYSISMMNGSYQLPLYLKAPIMSAAVIYLLVNLPPLLFLGEAERYLNHVAFFIVAGAVMLAMSKGWTLIICVLLAYGSIFWLIECFVLKRYFSQRAEGIEKADQEILSYLKKLKTPVVILSYPYHAIGVWRILLETPHKVLRTATGNSDYDKMFEQKYAIDFPFVNLDKLDDMATELGLNIFIGSKKFFAARGLHEWQPSLQWQKLELGEDYYDVYQRNFDK